MIWIAPSEKDQDSEALDRHALGVVAPNAVQRIKGITSTDHLDQAGSGTGKFLRSLAKTSQR
jgi:hypothetical protein